MSTRTLIRALHGSALALSVAVTLSACGSTAPAPSADAAVGNAPAAAADPAYEVLPAATADSPKATVAGDRPSASPSAPSPRPADPGAAKAPVIVSPASASASGRPTVAAATRGLRLDAYDRRTGKAVLALSDTGKGAPSPSATAAAVAAVRPGRLIDSPPSPAAPHGALLAITGVEPANDGKLEVSTRPATVSELLGQTWADIKSALDPRKIQVTPKLKDLKASYVPNPDGGQGSASAVLQLDANTSVPLPGGTKATLTGSVALEPSVMFSYRGAHGILAPEQAKVGFDLGAHADWRLTAGLSGSTGVRIPIATLTASPVVMVGEVPVVIVLNTTVYAVADADGTVSVDTTQEFDGSWGVHADYTKAGGWTSATEPVDTRVSPVKATFTGRASVRTGLTAEGSVALYDAVGVKATVEPYLRADVEGTVSIDSSSGAPTVHGRAGLYGGLDVNGAILARIAILGTPLFEKAIPFRLYHDEWPIVAREATTQIPSARPTPSPAN
ncbi:hypothetical protein [Streptomyces sp. NPDC048623]|uniref:hypothetical protein n=1 Tax=Streptomyces sp. NPDC048623 TaxID=3155761 RepID=UPI003427C981